MSAPANGPRPYLDRRGLGTVFGVSAAAVAHWQDRHPDFPPPDIVLGDRELPGWHPDRIPEIRDWHHNRPGQGAPGRPKTGRPPGTGRRNTTPPTPPPAGPVAPEPEELRRTELGPGWTTTSVGADDPDRTLWWHGSRVGHVRRTGKGWSATRASGVAETTGAGPRGIYPSRIKALRMLAAEAEHRRRAATPHADIPLDGLPGWQLTQTQAEHDTGAWRVIDPSGRTTGTVTRDDHGPRPEWRTTSGDPNHRSYAPATITPAHDDPARGHDYDLWRTRTAAAHAAARRHNPELFEGIGE